MRTEWKFTTTQIYKSLKQPYEKNRTHTEGNGKVADSVGISPRLEIVPAYI